MSGDEAKARPSTLSAKAVDGINVRRLSWACDSQVFSSEIIQGSLQPLGNVFVAFASDCFDQFHAVPMSRPTT
jgi:hypothetical protein